MKKTNTLNAMRYPIGLSDYKKVAMGNYVLIDKSLFIKDILDDGANVILITRPRRFGKTINMSMLRYFFDIVGAAEHIKLFEHRNIAKAKKNDGTACLEAQGKHPVIFLSLKDIKALTYDEAYQDIASLISNLYQEHRYLLDSHALFPEDKQIMRDIIGTMASPSNLKNALKNLSKYLSRHHNANVVLLIDEYDTPIHAAYLSSPQYHELMLEFMRGFLGGVLKDNVYLHKGVVTGILRIAQASLFSGLNNIKVHTLLDNQYSQYFGFTVSETGHLLVQSGLTDKKKDIQSWYNGYCVGNTTLYNPWSILCCLEKQGQLQAYWIETGEAGLLGTALRKQSIHVKLQLQQLMEGDTVEGNLDYRTSLNDLEHNPVAVWTLLVFSGYLNARPIHFRDDGEITCQLSIPNREVSGAYFTQIKQHYYTSVLHQHGVKKQLAIGIAFSGKQLSVRAEECLI